MRSSNVFDHRYEAEVESFTSQVTGLTVLQMILNSTILLHETLSLA